MRKRRSPLHNHIHASNIKNGRMIMPRPPPHPRLSHKLGHIFAPAAVSPAPCKSHRRPVQPIFAFPMQVFRSTIQGLLHASLLLQQWKPTYPRNILRHSSPALLKPSLSSPPVISHAFLSTPYSPCSPSSPPVALIPAAGFPA